MLEQSASHLDKFWEIYQKQDRKKIEEFTKYMDKFAVNFNLYKDGNFIERSLPFDVVPKLNNLIPGSNSIMGLRALVD